LGKYKGVEHGGLHKDIVYNSRNYVFILDCIIGDVTMENGENNSFIQFIRGRTKLKSLTKNGNIFFMLIIFTLIILRLLTSLLVHSDTAILINNNDAVGYIYLAENLINGRAYDSSDIKLELLRPPGYPLFLAGIIKIADINYQVIALVQLIISTITASIVFLLLKKTISDLAAKIGLFAFLIDPLSIEYSLKTLTETWFTFLFTLSILLIYFWCTTGKDYFMFVSGCTIGISSLFRPIGTAIFLCTLVLIIFYRLKSAKPINWFRFILPPILLTIGFVIFTTPWILHNKVAYNCAIFSSISIVTIRDWWATAVYADINNLPFRPYWDQISSTPSPICDQNSSQYLSFIFENPLSFLKLHLIGVWHLIFGFEPSFWVVLFDSSKQLPDFWEPLQQGILNQVILNEIKNRNLWIGLVFWMGINNLLLYIFGVYGFIRKWFMKDANWRWWLFFIGTMIFVFVNAPSSMGYERYRLPIQPLIIYLFALGVQEVLIRFTKMKPIDSSW
jgi:hypothetical protein